MNIDNMSDQAVLREALRQIMYLKRMPFEDPFAWQERARQIAKKALDVTAPQSDGTGVI